MVRRDRVSHGRLRAQIGDDRLEVIVGEPLHLHERQQRAAIVAYLHSYREREEAHWAPAPPPRHVYNALAYWAAPDGGTPSSPELHVGPGQAPGETGWDAG